MTSCEAVYDYQPGDGHTRGTTWRVCSRLSGHTGVHSQFPNDSMRAEDEARHAEAAKRFRVGISESALRHRRRQAAMALLESALRTSLHDPITIHVPVDPS